MATMIGPGGVWRRTFLLPTAAAVMAATVTVGASGAIRFVSPCGSDAWLGVNGVCTGPLGPKRTIQAALASAADGDEIRVLPGAYLGPIDLDGKAVHLVGIGGAAVTTVIGSGSNSVLRCNSGEGPDTVIEGLTITGGNVPNSGGGLFIALASPTILGCIISDNIASTNGAGAAVVLGSPHFEDCDFVGNGAGISGGGVSTSFGAPTFVDCLFQNNTAFHGGGIATSEGTVHIELCEIRDNEAFEGGGLYASPGELTIESSLFEGNLAVENGGGVHAANADLTIASTDLLNNTALDSGGGMMVASGVASATDLLVSSNDAELGGGIAASDGAELSIVGSTIGANDASSSGGGVFSTESSLTLFGCGINGNTAVTVGGVNASGGTLGVLGCTFTGNVGAFACGGAAASLMDADEAIIQLSNFVGNEGTIGGGAFLVIEGGATFEATSFTGNGASAGGAIADLSENSPGLVRVRDCLFTDNHAIGSGGAIRFGPLVELEAVRSEFVGNTVTGGDGGAVWTLGDVTRLASCIFRENTADGDGGAVWSTGSLSTVNCLYASNQSGESGGAIRLFNEGSSRVAQCTITANVAVSGGEAIELLGGVSLPITNSILWANGAPALGGGPFALSHSIVPAGTVGPGCLSLNPKFVSAASGNYRLLPSSPAVDAGLLWLVPNDDADLDDDGDRDEAVPHDLDEGARILTVSASAGDCGLAVDMGAYELPVGLAPPPAPTGDLNQDGSVGPIDLALLLAEWGAAGNCPIADLDGDGSVGAADLAILLASWTT